MILLSITNAPPIASGNEINEDMASDRNPAAPELACGNCIDALIAALAVP